MSAINSFSRPFPAIPRKEVYRYLGYRGKTPDEAVMQHIDTTAKDLAAVCVPRATWRLVPIRAENQEVLVEGVYLSSPSLCKHLQGCTRAYLMAATLGEGVDRLMTRFAATDATRMVLLQAVGAACLEAVLDDLAREWLTLPEMQGLSLRSRYSPGYGDFPLDCQKDLIRLLDAPRRIGLSLTQSHMLSPLKSVTAVAGIGLPLQPRFEHACALCSKTDCSLREQTT